MKAPKKCPESDGRHYVNPKAAQFLYQDGRVPALQATGDRTMSWQKSTIFAIDCLATFVGLLLALPFFLILASPFLVSY